MTAAAHSRRHWKLVARRQRLRELNASAAVLERNRLQIVANSHSWQAALLREHVAGAVTQAA